tara:strand:+ start:160 stop:669 length:510 start_codon:yes stop_codon:yes gene_type:complete
MSTIYQTLRKANFYSEPVFPKNIREGDLISDNNQICAVSGVLSPSEDKVTFFKRQNFNVRFVGMFYEIQENRKEFFVFLMNCQRGIFYRRHHPFSSVNVYCYKNSRGIIDKKKGFDIWMLKFSTEFVCKEKVLFGKKSVYDNFLETIKDGVVKDEIHAISGLMFLQYSQ